MHASESFNYNYNCVISWHVQYTSTVTLWEHARLELLIKCLVNFLFCTDDLLAATSSDIATTWSRMRNSKQLYCGWLKKEDAYRTVGHYLCNLACTVCMLELCYSEICGCGRGWVSLGTRPWGRVWALACIPVVPRTECWPDQSKKGQG